MRHMLTNGRIRLTFDDASGTIVSMRKLDDDHEYIRYDVPHDLFRLATLREGENGRKEWVPGRIRSVEVREDDSVKRMMIEWSGCADRALEAADPQTGAADSGELPVEVRVTIELGEGDDAREIVWKMDVHNHSRDHRVIEVLFPLVRGIGLGDRADDDVLIYPHHAGEKTVNPAAQYASEKYMKFWRAETRLEDGVYTREINYCGLASMTWMYLYDAEQGFYIGSHDPRFPVTGLRVETGGPASPWMGFGFRKYTTIRPGESWSSDAYVTALRNEDWHWGAKRYRRYIDRYIAMPSNPAFLDSEALLNSCYHFKQQHQVRNRFRNIPEMFAKGKNALGVRHMFIASWNRSGFDQDYPDFQPDMELGTPMALYRGVQHVNENGGFVTFYINVRIFDVNSYFYPTLGKKWAIKDDRQEMMPEQYGPYHFTVNCPSHDEWQDHIIDTAVWMVQSYGAKGIYLDQLGSAEPFPCYDPAHSHADNGQFNNGYVRVLREVLEQVRARDPETFLMIENCGDIYGPYVWGSLTWNGEFYDEFFNVFKYTFPEYVQVNMVNPRRGLTGEERRDRLHRDVARAMLLGSVFWIHFEPSNDPADPAVQHMHAAARFRTSVQPWIASAVYVDDEGVTASDGLDVSRWRLADGGELLLIANLQRRSGGTVTLQGGLSGRKARCEITDMDGGRSEAEAACADGRLTVPVPAAELSCVKIRFA